MAASEMIVVDTAVGAIPLQGAFSTFDAARPLLLLVRGAFGPPNQMWRLPEHHPQLDVVFANLPGMNGPTVPDPTVARFAQAFDEALDRTWPGRRAIVFGLSIGALVGLAMRRGEFLIALDPPLRTAPLWPMIPRLRTHLAEAKDPRLAEWVWNIFGVDEERVEDRDYRPLLAAYDRSGVVLVGADPLEPERPITRLPGLMTVEDRALAARHPSLSVLVAPDAGHSVAKDAPDVIGRAIDMALASFGA